jgi:peptidoglycan/LPS O-acetylase OafA/YrhL
VQERSAKWLLYACAVALFAISLNPDVERATSPHIWGLNVVLRKIYSIVAFAIVGFLLARVRNTNRQDVLAVALLIALYSLAIEVTQYALGSAEGFYWNLIDVFCGFVGGYTGGAISVLTNRRKPPLGKATRASSR